MIALLICFFVLFISCSPRMPSVEDVVKEYLRNNLLKEGIKETDFSIRVEILDKSDTHATTASRIFYRLGEDEDIFLYLQKESNRWCIKFDIFAKFEEMIKKQIKKIKNRFGFRLTEVIKKDIKVETQLDYFMKREGKQIFGYVSISFSASDIPPGTYIEKFVFAEGKWFFTGEEPKLLFEFERKRFR
jgi:hypothetical protein